MTKRADAEKKALTGNKYRVLTQNFLVYSDCIDMRFIDDMSYDRISISNNFMPNMHNRVKLKVAVH